MNHTNTWILHSSEQSTRALREHKKTRYHGERQFDNAYLSDTPLGPNGDQHTYLENGTHPSYDSIDMSNALTIDKTTIDAVPDDTTPEPVPPRREVTRDQLKQKIQDHQTVTQKYTQKTEQYRSTTNPLDGKPGKLVHQHLVETMPSKTYKTRSPRSSPETATPNTTNQTLESRAQHNQPINQNNTVPSSPNQDMGAPIATYNRHRYPED